MNVADHDVVIAVIGETPHAEGHGDLQCHGKTLAQSGNDPEGLAVLNAVGVKGKPVVTILAVRPGLVCERRPARGSRKSSS